MNVKCSSVVSEDFEDYFKKLDKLLADCIVKDKKEEQQLNEKAWHGRH